MSLAYQSLSKFSASKLNYSSDDTNKYTQRSERVKSQEYLDNIPQLIIKQQQELEDQLNRLKQLENQNQILHRDKANLQVRASHQKSNSSWSSSTSRSKISSINPELSIRLSQFLNPEEYCISSYKYGNSLKSFSSHLDDKVHLTKENLKREVDQKFNELINRYGQGVFEQIVLKRRKMDNLYHECVEIVHERLCELENWEAEQMISDVSVEEIPEIPKRLPIKHKKSKNKRISAQKFSNLDSLKEMTLNTRSGKFSEGKTVCLIKARLNEINRNQKNNIHTRKPIIYDSEEIIEFVWRDPVKTFRTSSPNPRRLGFV